MDRTLDTRSVTQTAPLPTDSLRTLKLRSWGKDNLLVCLCLIHKLVYGNHILEPKVL